jgi:NADH-quinone oxidoreductase subunit M
MVGALAVPGVVLAAAYMLRLLQKMAWADSDGHHGPHGRSGLADINMREWFMLAVLAVFVFWLGFKPGLVLDVMDASVHHLINHMVR